MTTTTNHLALSSNTLGFNLLKTLRAAPGNLAFSPTSISTALSMTWAGARGDTAIEMGKALNLNISPAEMMGEYSKLVAGLLYDANFSGIDLTIANRLFGDKSLTFNGTFVENLSEVIATQGAPTQFGSGPEKVDLGIDTLNFEDDPEGARAFINNWIESKTKNRIKNLLPSGSIDGDTRLVIANAIYFLANWAAQFDKKSTYPDKFYNEGEKYSCNMMYRKGEYNFVRTNEVDVIELPYVGGSMSMVIALPQDVNGLSHVEQGLTNDRLMMWRRQLRKQTVSVRLPRFTIDSGSPIALSGHLKQLGMEKAFTEEANFTGIAQEQLSISEAYHKTFIKVNEQGTEMAAATAVAAMRGMSMEPSFRADHPFYWFIIDGTSDLVLGMGRVTEPKE